ncbi:MAG: polyphosphate kinase 1 [Acidimicrobiia bacterium]|jgi:polyphosphate kinase
MEPMQDTVEFDIGAPPDGDPVRPLVLNRELSWLDFNSRVLALAEDPDLPMLERARFLAIWGSNLDEFFMVRVAGLKEQVAHGVRGMTPDGRTAVETLEGIRDEVRSQADRATRVFLDDLAPGLAAAGVAFSEYASLDEGDRAYMDQQFRELVFPVLTPLAVDPAHPFPYISNLSLNLAVTVRDPVTEVIRFARVKVPPSLPRFVVMPDGERFVSVEQVIAFHMEELFPGMEILGHDAFRVTRNADLEIEEDQAEDLLAAIETELSRRRFGRAVRLELSPEMAPRVRDLLVSELGVTEDDVYVNEGPLGIAGLAGLADLDRSDLLWEPWSWVTQPRLAPSIGERPDIFRVIRDGDILVHHPYDSFATSVAEFIAQAARDPHVLAIKQTLYRTSKDSVIMSSLMEAASLGKQVVALVELKARFDEERNIEWSQRLEDAGVHVVYGVVGLKTHTKIALVVRLEDGIIARYAHVGTGNYNDSTARIYEDLGVFTADPDIGADLSDLFNYLTGYSHQRSFRKLLVSPAGTRPALLRMIREQAAQSGGRIFMKMNSLVDREMIETLYEASQAGAQVDLFVRGICCLVPGVPGMSENIRVRSIVGRYLEHSRVYRFGPRGGERSYFIGSADLMPRNLDRRVEALAPVEDPALQFRIDEIADVVLADDVRSWELGPDGEWRRIPTERGIEAHLTLRGLAEARAQARTEA